MERFVAPRTEGRREGRMKDDLTICHGNICHGFNSKDDCVECIEVNIFWYKELKRAGGITKFTEKLKKANKLLQKGEEE